MTDSGHSDEAEVESSEEVPVLPESQQQCPSSDVCHQDGQHQTHWNTDVVLQTKTFQLVTHSHLFILVVRVFVQFTRVRGLRPEIHVKL